LLHCICLLLAALACVVRAETVVLPAVANAGVSSIRGEGPEKPDQRNWSWRGGETLAIRQNQNWAMFENKTILLKFDTTAIKGWTVKEAFLHLALAKDDLYGIGACTVLSDWREGAPPHPTLSPQGRGEGEGPEAGAPSWNYALSPAPGQNPDGRNWWAWPASGLYSVAWLHPALRYSHAGPNQITRYSGAPLTLPSPQGGEGKKAGVRWLKFPIAPALVHAMAIGASYGMVLTDDKGQVAEACMLEKNPKPYVYDAGFEIQVYSRHAKDGALAPKLEVTGEADDHVPPAAPLTLPSPQGGEGRVRGATGAVSLEFTAPGDDGMQGCAHAYRVRYSGDEITEANWGQALEIPRYALPLPRPAGEKQVLRLMTLRPGTWHVALRAVDKAGNQGPLVDFKVKVPAPARRRFAEAPRQEGAEEKSWDFDKTLAVWAVDDLLKVSPLISARIKDAAAPSKDAVQLKAARNEVAAFQLVLQRLGGAISGVKLAISDLEGPNGHVIPAAGHIELFREWYVKSDDAAGWVADACLPLSAPFAESFDIPAQDNVGEAQRNQAVWVDVYVPKTAAAGEYRGTITITTPALKELAKINLVLTVRPLVLPDEITFPVELNTYGGIGSFAGVDIGKQRERYLKIERSYYQLAQKHRCTLNILRYTHSGSTCEDAVPPVAGEGAARHIADWSAWDARFGPYLDGSAFTAANGYYGPCMNTPLTHFYLPCHENWPLNLDQYYADHADFPDRKAFAEWARKSRRLDETVAPEYIAGYKKVVAEMMVHFERKQWTRTAFQFFLNNKYYYKCPFFHDPALGMSDRSNGRCYWLLDEPADFDDMDANRFFLSLAQQGVKDSGVSALKLHYRTDVSNPHMARGLWDGVCNLWCCSVLPEVVTTARVRQKWVAGENWANYGGGAGVSEPAVKQVQLFLNRYSLGTAYVLPYWKNFGAGWGRADDTSIYYSGVKYAGTDKVYDGALPGLRLKLLRRAQQDIEYLNLLAGCKGWDRDQVIQALSAWADTPDASDGLTFWKLSERQAAELRDAIAATIKAEAFFPPRAR